MTKKRLKPAVRRVFIAGAIVLVAILAIGGYIIFDEYSYRFSAIVEKKGVVNIYPDDNFMSVAKKLEKGGYIASAKKMERMAIKHDQDTVCTGSYLIEQGDSWREILTRFNLGRQTPVRATFNNIRTLEQLAGRVARYTLADSVDFIKFFRAQAAASKNRHTYIARFIPNTYEIFWTVSPEEFSAAMKDEYDNFWGSKGRRSKADDLGLTPDQVVTVASIVIEETKAEKEMSDVAGVYINRLAKGIALQADPTVKFAIGDFSIRRVLHKHLRYDSPYNTYRNKGLPPGPICSPAIVAIDAVLDYGDHRHNWLYFCAAADFSGTHSFAASLAEHNRNAAAYHRALDARRIRR